MTIWHSKVFWFNGITALSLILALPELHAALPGAEKWIILFQSAINVGFRVFATSYDRTIDLKSSMDTINPARFLNKE